VLDISVIFNLSISCFEITVTPFDNLLCFEKTMNGNDVYFLISMKDV